MYADDTVIYNTASTAEAIANALTKELNTINNWMQNNSLFIHQGKTECVLFGTGPRLATVRNFSVSVGGHSIKRVSEFKYLGVLLDENLSWTAHVNYLTSKAGKRLGMLNRARKNISMNISMNTKYNIQVFYSACPGLLRHRMELLRQSKY